MGNYRLIKSSLRRAVNLTASMNPRARFSIPRQPGERSCRAWRARRRHRHRAASRSTPILPDDAGGLRLVRHPRSGWLASANYSRVYLVALFFCDHGWVFGLPSQFAPGSRHRSCRGFANGLGTLVDRFGRPSGPVAGIASAWVLVFRFHLALERLALLWTFQPERHCPTSESVTGIVIAVGACLVYHEPAGPFRAMRGFLWES